VAENVVKRMDSRQREDDDAVEKAVARSLKRASQRIWDRRPIVETLVCGSERRSSPRRGEGREAAEGTGPRRLA
jgi:hypothetical protein